MAIKHLHRLMDEDTNPCVKEANISLHCLEKNFYVREKCALEYENYKNCKKFWGKVKNERKMAGIQPYLPKKEERNKIMELKEKGIYVSSVKD